MDYPSSCHKLTNLSLQYHNWQWHVFYRWRSHCIFKDISLKKWFKNSWCGKSLGWRTSLAYWRLSLPIHCKSLLDFIDEFQNVLHSIFLSKQKCLILGDFNINTLVKSTVAKEYLNLIHSEGFNPFIFKATRVTESTTSCIDYF